MYRSNFCICTAEASAAGELWINIKILKERGRKSGGKIEERGGKVDKKLRNRGGKVEVNRMSSYS